MIGLKRKNSEDHIIYKRITNAENRPDSVENRESVKLVHFIDLTIDSSNNDSKISNQSVCDYEQSSSSQSGLSLSLKSSPSELGTNAEACHEPALVNTSDSVEKKESEKFVHFIDLTVNSSNNNSKISNQSVCNYEQSSPSELGSDAEDLFSTLPDELIISIFKLLPQQSLRSRCSLVSKRWKTLSEDKSLWKEIMIQDMPICITGVRRILAYSPKALLIARLIPACSVHSNTFICHDNPNFDGLEDLRLYGCHLTPASLNNLLSPITQLTKLVIKSYESTNTFNHGTYQYIAANRDLRALNLKNVGRMIPMGLENILRNCKKLSHLHLPSYLSLRSLNVISWSIPHSIRKLNISYQPKLEDYHVKRIMDRCQNLISFKWMGTNESMKPWIVKRNK